MNNTKLAIHMMAVVMTIGGAPFLSAATQPVPGEERRWALDFRTRLEQPGTTQPVEIHLNGEWISTVSAVRPGEYDTRLQLESARGTRDFWATYRNDGMLMAVHFYKEMESGERNLLQMIATEAQFVGADANQTSWTALERDGGGVYLASYSRTDANVVTKHKVKYVHADGAAGKVGSSLGLDIERSAYRFVLDAFGAPASLDSSIRVRMGIALGNDKALAAETELHLSGLRTGEASQAIGSLARALPEVVSSAVRTQQPDPEQVRARLDAQLLEGHTTESLLESTPDPDRLPALFRRRPETIAIATGMLRSRGPRRSITDALASAGSPASIEALRAIACDRTLSRVLRIDAISAFILMQHPGVEAMRVPGFVLDDDDAKIASAARMASGALARSGRAAHAEESAAIDRLLVARYGRTQDAGELTELLAAMGNSGGAAVAAVIEGALNDPRNAVRVAAVRALRLVEDSKAESLLAGAMVNDADAGVRAAAIFAAGFRPAIGVKVTDALIQAAKADAAEQVRVGAINLLRLHRDTPHVAEALAWVAQHDVKPSVRKLAQEGLR